MNRRSIRTEFIEPERYELREGPRYRFDLTRRFLIETAAAKFGRNPTGLEVRDGAVTDPATAKRFGYTDLGRAGDGDGALADLDGVEAELIPRAAWRVLGTSFARVDAAAIVTGRHRYPSDVVLPGMLYGCLLRPPAYGLRLEFIALDSVGAMEGVTPVRDGDFVGFVAPTSFQARRARDVAAASARWSTRPDSTANHRDLTAFLRNGVSEGGGRSRRRGGGNRGSVSDGLGAARKVIRAEYPVAYIQHAPMEPRAAVAEWREDRLTVWTGTQQPSRVARELAAAFRLAEDRVRVIVPDTGGGFGGKHTGDAAVEAARLALAAQRPVSLRWTREEEFVWAYFRPAGVIDIAAGLDEGGALIAWEQINFNSGSSAIETPYDVPNARSEFKRCESPLREGSYRALASTANVFARESAMDELAAAAGADPLAFRLRHLSHPRLRAVLEATAARFGWEKQRRQFAGSAAVGVGLACGTEKGSYAAACVKVELDEAAGRYRVTEVCEGFECGAIQNPANLRAQIEGCIIQGLGGALSEEIEFENGAILNPRFSSYAVPRFADTPKIEAVLLDRPDLPSVGAGETPIVPVAPAVANALAAVAGVRIRSLPIRDDRFRPG